jgi:hypothetical protein
MKRNNGDGITAYILRDSFGLQPVFGAHSAPHLLGIGSIFHLANQNSQMWGSGVLDPKYPFRDLQRSQIHAVRGEKTASWLRVHGLNDLDVPLGDPGFLIGDVVASERLDRTVRHTIALVPHHVHFNSAWVQAVRRRGDIAIVDMMDNGLKPVEQILQAEIVVSQSLHGLIFAEALGKPNVWISSDLSGLWRYKFEDWFSTTREPQKAPVKVDAPVLEWIANARLHNCAIDTAALKASFPRNLLAQPPKSVIPFDACRWKDPTIYVTTQPLFAEPRLASDFTEKDVASLKWRVGEIAKTAFANYSEPTYLCIHDGSFPLPPRVVEEATRMLDWHGRCMFALLKPNGRLEAGPTATDTDSLAPAQRLISGTLLLRPDGSFSPKARYLDVSF